MIEHQQWNLLAHLRGVFLEEENQERKIDYWNREEILSLYDQTFAQRIGWKWQAVLRDFQKKSTRIFSENITILDWGCGTGIASRTFFDFFSKDLQKVQSFVFDRSKKATTFAINKIKTQHVIENITCSEWIPHKHQFLDQNGLKILLLSHILNEIDEKIWEKELKILLSQADFIFWVEPGTHSISRKLIECREELLLTHFVVSPCPQQKSCPLRQPEQVKHWCHQFASPPVEVFQSSFWGEFSKKMKIDLRSLPVSFLILSSKKMSFFDLPATSDRMIGRGKKTKHHVSFFVCQTNALFEEKVITKRQSPKEYKDWTDLSPEFGIRTT